VSKYEQLRELMGGQEVFNDATKTGRVLKWYADSEGMPKGERDVLAAKIKERLVAAGAHYVQKVQVRNAKMSRNMWVGAQYKVMTFDDFDKICVYIDKLP